MNFAKGGLGWIEVVCGPMFSGKSEELIRRLRRAEIARQRVQIFKPGIDQRFSEDHIVSHSDLKIRSEAVKNATEVMARVDLRTEVIGIDEAQFLGTEMVEVAIRLGDMGKRVIIAGLDTDYLGRPFHPMPELLAIADEITKALAICVQCGNPAKHTQRLVASEDLIVVGAAGMYEARCRRCFEPELASLKSTQQTTSKQTAQA
jgi:thymidine kinase